MNLLNTGMGMIGDAYRVIFRPNGGVSATNVQKAIEELDAEKQAVNSGLTDIAALTPTDSNIIVGDGSNWVAESGATARTSLGAQTEDAALTDISGLTVTDGNIIVADGTNWVAENGATARASLGLVIGTDVQAFNAGLGEIAGLSKADGNIIVGTGSAWVAESGATARTTLGLSIGSDVQAHSARLTDVAGLAVADGNIIVGDGTNWVAENGATARTSLGLSIGSDVQAFQATQSTATWETGTGTTESVVSPAKVKAVIDALGSGASFASAAEVRTGTETAKAIAPATAQDHESAVKAWVQFNGTGTLAVGDSYNVSSVTDNGTGDYTVNFTTAFANANYAAAGMSRNVGNEIFQFNGAPAAGSCRVYSLSRAAGAPIDNSHICIMFSGTQ